MTTRLMAVLLAIAISATTAHGQAGSIAVTSDPSGADCHISDLGPGLVTVYVVHVMLAGATASRFKIEEMPGVNMVYADETVQHDVYVGDTRTGITICYGTCVGPSVLVAMRYITLGTSEPCSIIRAVPHPASETVDVIDCGGNPLVASCFLAYVNGGLNCSCVPPIPVACSAASGPGPTFGCTVPVESSTWGAIKNIFVGERDAPSN